MNPKYLIISFQNGKIKFLCNKNHQQNHFNETEEQKLACKSINNDCAKK